MTTFFQFLVIAAISVKSFQCLLQPRESESREIKSLDGIWNFRLSPSLEPEKGFNEQWYNQDLRRTGSVQDMPVPSSFNDITTEQSTRDFVGWAWYDRKFFTPSTWNASLQNIILRFGSAHYTTVVWVNGVEVMTHAGGHLPFEVDVTNHLLVAGTNILTVALNNTLTPSTVPQGYWRWKSESENYPASYFELYYTFDFFNYAGIHRPVLLYTVPKSIKIDDVTVTTTVTTDLTSATLSYAVAIDTQDIPSCVVQLFDKEGSLVAGNAGCSGDLVLNNPMLWWPHMMNPDPGYLYNLEILAADASGNDVYRLPVGIREITWSNTTFQINHQDFYFRGFGWHEDSNIRGKGLDLARITKDFNLMKWTGANSFRTSHYPYAEEIMDFADRNGIVVIDECPGVNLEIFDQPLLDNHLRMIEELVSRDKNRPSVVMWSIANEARSDTDEARPYFQAVADRTKALDPTRPTTLATYYPVSTDQAPYAVDIIMINRYASWYTDTGHLNIIQRQLTNNIRDWNEKHGKLVLVSEYGADTISGFHELPSTIWTEEYQTDMMMEFFKGFDTMRNDGILIGEMIWNFADFMTKQEYKRAWGNRKGVFTRDRHPKAAAHLIRSRYLELADLLDK